MAKIEAREVRGHLPVGYHNTAVPHKEWKDMERIPRTILECQGCGAEFDPYAQLMLHCRGGLSPYEAPIVPGADAPNPYNSEKDREHRRIRDFMAVHEACPDRPSETYVTARGVTVVDRRGPRCS